jgi:hypothetical protein
MSVRVDISLFDFIHFRRRMVFQASAIILPMSGILDIRRLIGGLDAKIAAATIWSELYKTGIDSDANIDRSLKSIHTLTFYLPEVLVSPTSLTSFGCNSVQNA